MSVMYYQSESRYSSDLPGPAGLVAELNFQKLREAQIRFITSNDSSKSIRNKWMVDLGLHYDEFELSVKPEIALSSAKGFFNIVIFGSDDVSRLTKYIKEYRSQLRGKVAICLTTKSTAQKRARLIMAGFDDVFDTQRIQSVEALARISAIWSRYDLSRENQMRVNEDEIILSSMANLRFMTPKQRLVFEHLAFSPKRKASYDVLCSVAGEGHPITLENLKVIVCNIRKMLKPGYVIKSDRQSHYMLI